MFVPPGLSTGMGGLAACVASVSDKPPDLMCAADTMTVTDSSAPARNQLWHKLRD